MDLSDLFCYIHPGVWLAPRQSYNYPGAGDMILKDIDKLNVSNHNKTRQNTNHMHIPWDILYIDGLMQERRNSSALAMELRLSCTNPLICPSHVCVQYTVCEVILIYKQSAIYLLLTHWGWLVSYCAMNLDQR